MVNHRSAPQSRGRSPGRLPPQTFATQKQGGFPTLMTGLVPGRRRCRISRNTPGCVQARMIASPKRVPGTCHRSASQRAMTAERGLKDSGGETRTHNLRIDSLNRSRSLICGNERKPPADLISPGLSTPMAVTAGGRAMLKPVGRSGWSSAGCGPVDQVGLSRPRLVFPNVGENGGARARRARQRGRLRCRG